MNLVRITVFLFPLLGHQIFGEEMFYNVYGSLQEKLMKNYRKDVKPVWNQTEQVKIEINLIPTSVINFDETRGILTTSFLLDLIWKDEIITWDPASYQNITYTRFSHFYVWKPLLYSPKAYDTFVIEVDEAQSVVYRYDGEARYVIGIKSSTMCSPNSRYFPFDIQNCYIDINPSLTFYEVHFIANRVIDGFYEENPLWDLLLIDTLVYNEHIFFKTPIFRIVIRLQRRHSFFLMNIFAPIVFLAVVNLGVFILPVESGERISFSLTVLLSFAVFLTLVTGYTPKSSLTVSLFSIYMLVILTYSSLITFSNIFILDIHFTKGVDKPKLFLSRFLVRFAEPLTRCKTAKKDVTPADLDVDRCEDREDSSYFKYQIIASTLDKAFILFYGLFFVSVTLIFLTYISLKSETG